MRKICSILLAILVLISSFNLVAFADATITFAPVNSFFSTDGVIAGTKYEFQATATLDAGQSIAYYNGDEQIGTIADTSTVVLVTVNEGENRIYAKILGSTGETIAVSPETVLQGVSYTDVTAEPALFLDFTNGATTGFYCSKPFLNANDIIDEEHGKSLAITTSYNGEGAVPVQDQISMSLPAYESAGNIFESSVDLYFKDFTPSDRQIMGFAGSGIDAYNVTVHRGGDLKVATQGKAEYDKGNTIVKTLETNKWYNFKRIVNFRDKTISLYVDGVFMHKKEYSKLETKVPDKLIYRSYQETWNYGNVTIAYYLDNVTFKQIAPNATAAVSYITGGAPVADPQQVPYENTQIKVEFTEAMDETLLTSDNVVLATSDGVVAGTTLAYDSTTKSLQIVPDADLNPNQNYTLSLNNLKSTAGLDLKGTKQFTFKTEKLPFCIDEITLAGDNVTVDGSHGSTVTANIKFRNITDSEKQAVLFIGVFDAYSLYDYVIAPVSVVASPVDPVPASLDIPAATADYKIKACLVENTSALNIFDVYSLD